jgi:hypothetical protein
VCVLLKKSLSKQALKYATGCPEDSEEDQGSGKK